MNVPRVSVLVPILMCTLFAACSLMNDVTREEMRPLARDDFRNVDHYVIDSVLHYKIDLRGDTLVCVQRTRAATDADGTRIPLKFDAAVRSGVESREVIMLVFLPEAVIWQSGDTLYIPTQALDTTRQQVLNSGTLPEIVQTAVLITGAVMGIFGVILLVVVVVAFIALFSGGT